MPGQGAGSKVRTTHKRLEKQSTIKQQLRMLSTCSLRPPGYHLCEVFKAHCIGDVQARKFKPTIPTKKKKASEADIKVEPGEDNAFKDLIQAVRSPDLPLLPILSCLFAALAIRANEDATVVYALSSTAQSLPEECRNAGSGIIQLDSWSRERPRERS